MKSRIALFFELAFSVFVVALLSGCFGDGGSEAAYDGTWTVQFGDSAFVEPAAASGATVACYLPTIPATINLVDGVGSTLQMDYCTGTVAGTTNIPYYISVAITPATGKVNAIVNGSPLTGQCISAFGCQAQNSTASLSLTR